jgi:hypothetical protein
VGPHALGAVATLVPAPAPFGPSFRAIRPLPDRSVRRASGGRRGPLDCRDAYGRSTGARRFSWSNQGRTDAYAGTSNSSGAVTAAALDRWADRLRRRGVAASLFDPGGEAASDRRFQVGSFGAGADGVLSVRASFYASALEITATTGCHRD